MRKASRRPHRLSTSNAGRSKALSSAPIITTNSSGGLTVKAYAGDGAVLLAFDLDQTVTQGLAGFAIRRTPPSGPAAYLLNRLNFTTTVTAGTNPQDRVWTPSNVAPFQKFRWVDFPGEVNPGVYQYDITAMYFGQGTQLKAGPVATVSADLRPREFGAFEFGFTRGYMSSQAYATIFKNAPFRPPTKSIDYNTQPYEKQYEWLGYHARQMVFNFLDECVADPSLTVDLFAYDLDEPDFVRGLQQLKGRLRAYLDDAPLHTQPGALEIQAQQLLLQSAGSANVKTGHF